MPKKKTTSQFKNQVASINPNIEVIGEYTGARNKIGCKCKICGCTWEPLATNVLKGQGCPGCAKANAGKQFIVPEESFRKKLYDKFGGTISLLDEYTKATSPMRYKCNRCGNVISCSSGINIFYTNGCKVCNGIRTRYTPDEFRDIVESYGKVHVIGEFKNSDTKIRVKCNKCEYEYDADPYLVSHGCGCRKCADKQHGLALRKSHEQFIEDVAKVNPYIKILGVYNGAEQHIDCECTICGHKWSPVASSL